MELLAAQMTYLDDLAIHYGTDKASTSHNYTAQYEVYFAPLRYEPIVVLEFGIGGHENPRLGGASLRTWAHYFPKATVIGIDNEAKELDFTEFNGRIHPVLGSQDDAALIDRLADEYGPFDIVIDDASHLSSKTIAALEAAWPHIKPGGFYVCEDTHMAYHDWYYGPDEANENPDQPRADGSPTIMQYLRRMTDDVNRGLFPPQYWRGYSLEWAHFYFNITFLKKA